MWPLATCTHFTAQIQSRSVPKTAPEVTSTPAVIPLHLLVGALIGWLQGEQHKVIAYLREENRVLKVQLQGQRLRLTDDD